VDDAELDPVVTQVASDWLAEYARFLRRSPEVAARLAERPEEFELVPIPRMLLDRLAVPGIMGSGGLGDAEDDIERLRALAEDPETQGAGPRPVDEGAAEVVHRLANALARGDVDGALRLFSPAFVDRDGRNLREIRETLAGLVGATTARRLEVVDLATEAGAAGEVVVRGTGRWHVSLADEGDGPALAEALSFDARLLQDRAGEWHIADFTAR
jgi:hypothetical protein